MKLTTQNAAEYIGKQLTGGPFHHWPLRVKQIGGRYFVVDRNGVMMPLNDSDAVFFEKAE